MSHTIELPVKKDKEQKKDKKWKFTKMFRSGKTDSDSKLKQDPEKPVDSKRTRAVTSPPKTNHMVNSLVPKAAEIPHSGSSMKISEEAKQEEAEVPQKEKVKPQFGVPLVKLCELFPEEPVPAVLLESIKILEADIRKEGIFRIPGRMTSIVEMKTSFEDGNGLGVEEPNTLEIAGLVAQFFRELPEPLLTYDLYYSWVEAAKKENEEKIRETIVELLKQIPEANYNTLKCFIAFLVTVSKNSGANRMGARNLALVFGASLLNPPSIDQYDLMNIKLQCSVIEHMITGFSFIFDGVADDAAAPKVREKQVATIPAGNPGSNHTSAVPPVDRRKKFMKRKSTFFATAHYSGNSQRIQDFITPIKNLGTKKPTPEPSPPPTIEEPKSSEPTSPDVRKKKKRKKKRPKSSRKNSEERDEIIQEVDVQSLPEKKEEEEEEHIAEKVKFLMDTGTPKLEDSTSMELMLTETDCPEIEIISPPSVSDGDEEDAEDEIYDTSEEAS